MADRRQNRRHRVQAADHVRHPDPDLHRLAFGISGQAHDTAIALCQQIIARLVRIGSRLAEPCDRAIDKPRVVPAQAVVIQTVFREPADLEILDEDIAMPGKMTDRLGPLFGGDIHGDRSFVSVGRQVIGALCRGFPVGSGHIGRTPGPGVIPKTRFLDLDDFRAVIAQQLRAGRTRKDTGQVQHPKPVKRPRRSCIRH